jgi:hypothetical protein
MINRMEYLRRVDEAHNVLPLDNICNGVGSKLLWLRIFRCPPDIAELFEEAANWHDVAYYLGGGAVEKMYADTAFFNYLMEAVYGVDCSWAARWRLRLWAYLCYTAVRLGGELAFNWTKE